MTSRSTVASRDRDATREAAVPLTLTCMHNAAHALQVGGGGSWELSVTKLDLIIFRPVEHLQSIQNKFSQRQLVQTK